MNEKELAKRLRNIGPVVAAKLVRVGIDSPEKLKSLGAKEAYFKLYTHGELCGSHHACYLYALHGAIIECDWRKIPETKKEEFKQYTKLLRS